MSSFRLLGQRRFAPFFVVQFLGAFNDNIFKNATVLLLTTHAISEAQAGRVSGLAAAMLIVPFLLFSLIAGQICEKFPKARVIRVIKAAEILIMALGAYAYAQQSDHLLFLTLFLLGTHSAMFGPAKFSILPQIMRENELVGANALIELGTFLAIILGTILGGIFSKWGFEYVAISVITLAVLGQIASFAITTVPASEPNLKISLNPLSEIASMWKLLTKNRTIFLSILGISWFWFLGTSIMLQLPSFSKFLLHGDETTVTMLLAVFCTSVGIGSVICEKLSGQEIEIGLVPIGAFGISLFFFDLALIDINFAEGIVYSYRELLAQEPWVAYRVLFDLFGMGFSGALFIIPLNTLLQHRSEPNECSRIIAGNNIINALFMTAASVLATALYSAGLSTQQIFSILAITNIVASIYMFSIIPEFTMRFIVWVLASTIYRLRYTHRDRIPKTGPGIIVSNHVSYIDWFIIAAACRRPVRFVMYYKFFEAPLINSFFRLGKAIPIASAKESESIKANAFALIKAELADGNLICIFPEGTLTHSGAIEAFKPGIEDIQRQSQVPVIPLMLHGLWGSFFSRSGGKAIAKLPRPKWRVIDVEIGEPFKGFVSASDLQKYYETQQDQYM